MQRANIIYNKLILRGLISKEWKMGKGLFEAVYVLRFIFFFKNYFVVGLFERGWSEHKDTKKKHKENLFTVQLVEHWLIREVVDTPYLEIFRTQLDTVLSNRL